MYFKCGLLKENTLMCHISLPHSSDFVTQLCYKYGMKDINMTEKDDWIYGFKVIINGNWKGVHHKPYDLVDKLRKLRRNMCINYETEIILDPWTYCVRIYTDGGRSMRPLLIVENGQIKLTKKRVEQMLGKDPQFWKSTFDDLLAEGLVEFIGIEEEEYNCLVAIFPEHVLEQEKKKYSHCEVHPSTMYGAIVADIPFSNHNFSVRNSFQCSMQKAAISVPFTNFNRRFDTTMYVLHYPQKPLVTTMLAKIMKFNELPATIAPITAIMSMRENQEDGIIFCQDSIDFGMARISIYRTTYDICRNQGNSKESFKAPNREICYGMINSNYSELQEDGIVEPGTIVTNSHILIGKTTPFGESKNDLKTEYIKEYEERDRSHGNKNKEPGVIDQVIVGSTADGSRFTKVKTRHINVPKMGDK